MCAKSDRAEAVAMCMRMEVSSDNKVGNLRIKLVIYE